MGQRVVIVGGGVGGLATALVLGRAGHAVTLLERDPLPPTADAEATFAAERRGAPQVHQTHGFLARVVVELRRRLPDVLEDLLASGVTVLPATANLGEPQPGDEDLAVLIVRRTTFEWVLRKAAVAEPSIDVRTDVTVEGLVADEGSSPPRVTGVRLAGGEVVEADVVVASTGRRGDVPAWLAGVGVDVEETIVESGLVYVSRWYRLPPDHGVPLDPKLGGDLQFVKFLAVPGDGDTLSVTIAVPSADSELRAALSDPDRFDRAVGLIPGPDRFFAGGAPEPIGGVRPMGGLLNRLRRFVDADGAPLVSGFHAVGDAHTCTNPLYGRGCSLALVHAGLLADALAEHPDDPVARARAYEAGSARQVQPWYEQSVQMDRMGADPAGLGSAADTAQGKAMAAVMVAAATDPVIGRAMTRLWNLLTTPAELAADVEATARMMAVMADPDAWPVPPREGPTRDELLAALDALPAPSEAAGAPA